jgi:carbon storage regulator
MLVLSRKQSQRIKLGDSIVITVVRVAGDKVRLGIDAPRDMLVLRDELEPHDLPAGPAGITAEARGLISLSRSA